jgi:hypothetical protein
MIALVINMKNKFAIFNFKLFYYLKQLISNEYPDNKSEVKKHKIVVENDLRWEDDGGPVVEIADPTLPSGGELVSPDDGCR